MILKKLSKIIKQKRLEKKMTLQDVADAVGFKTRGMAHHIETGRAAIPKDKRKAYLFAVGLKLKDVEQPIKEELWSNWINGTRD